MTQAEFDLHLYQKNSFSQKICISAYHALKFKFPDIVNLHVYIGDDFEVYVEFDESEEITSAAVISFLNEFKKTPLKQTNYD